MVASTRVMANSSRARRAKTLSTPSPKPVIWRGRRPDVAVGEHRRALVERFDGSLEAILDQFECVGVLHDRAFADQADQEVGPGRDFQRLVMVGNGAKAIDDIGVDAMGGSEQAFDLSPQRGALRDRLFERREVGLQPLR